MSESSLVVLERYGDLGLGEEVTWGITVAKRVAQYPDGALSEVVSIVVTTGDGTDISDLVLVGDSSFVAETSLIVQKFTGAELTAGRSYRCVATFEITVGDDTETQSVELEIRAR